MKYILVLLALAGMLAGGCRKKSPPAAQPSAPPPEVIARLHFVGKEIIEANTNAATFKTIWDLPETMVFRDLAFEKWITNVVAMQAMVRTNATETNLWPLVKPLVSDLFQVEWYGEWEERTNQPPAWTLAARLNADQAKVWQTNLTQLTSDWQWKQPLAFRQERDWMLIGSSPVMLSTNQPIVKEIASRGRPLAETTNYWFRFEGNLAKVRSWFPFLPGKNLPHAEFNLVGRGDSLRTEALLRFPTPRRLKFEPWEFPTNTIREPLISFTALQGFSDWLSEQPLIKSIEFNTVPNQICLWGEGRIPLQAYVAAPMPGVTNFLERITTNLVPQWNTNFLAPNRIGEIRAMTNHQEMVWLRLPIMVPFLRPAFDTNREFLFAGIFPLPPGTNPPPPSELFKQLNRTNLVYYDWEITQHRMVQVRLIAQLASLVLNKPTVGTNAPPMAWLDAIESRLGESVTEITASSAQDFKLVRKSFVGLNGIELYALARWVASTNFPAFDWARVFQIEPRATNAPPKL